MHTVKYFIDFHIYNIYTFVILLLFTMSTATGTECKINESAISSFVHVLYIP